MASRLLLLKICTILFRWVGVGRKIEPFSPDETFFSGMWRNNVTKNAIKVAFSKDAGVEFLIPHPWNNCHVASSSSCSRGLANGSWIFVDVWNLRRRGPLSNTCLDWPLAVCGLAATAWSWLNSGTVTSAVVFISNWNKEKEKTINKLNTGAKPRFIGVYLEFS